MLLLSETEVPLGARVFLCPPGSEQPASDEEGQRLSPLVCLVGGIPIRRKFYPIEDLRVSEKVLIVTSFENFDPGVRFAPVEVFSASTAPPNTEFAVFVNRERLRYEKYPRDRVEILKDSRGQLISVCGYAYDNWQCQFPLPADAVLVPTTEVGKSRYAPKTI
ncbi:MAG: hypothetical protein A2749_01275 [Parcubacteria group bacterium RIFCSPHIGHO2_01_FULL_45_26]|nr:MAG: hypothetical protein A2749_01275 [Parcubacteria group bacterium RIFCSPHIGHO2_01_FULL_45_26]